MVSYSSTNTDVYDWRPTLKMIEKSKIKITLLGEDIIRNIYKELAMKFITESNI